jgi:hypothetical protein
LNATLSEKHIMLDQPVRSLRECIRSPQEGLPVTIFWGGLKTQEKCILAFVLANSALEFYNSCWMYEEWTKDQIYFKPFGSLGVPLLRKPYLSVRFEDLQFGRAQFDINGCRSIFDLGILLLEIHTNSFIEDDFTDQATSLAPWALRATALDLLKSLAGEKQQNSWNIDGDQDWSVRGLYQRAITACLSHDRLIQSDPGCDPTEKLRQIIQGEVVRPLRTILMRGYNMSAEELDDILFGSLPTTPPGLSLRRPKTPPVPQVSFLDYTSGSGDSKKCGFFISQL